MNSTNNSGRNCMLVISRCSSIIIFYVHCMAIELQLYCDINMHFLDYTLFESYYDRQIAYYLLEQNGWNSQQFCGCSTGIHACSAHILFVLYYIGRLLNDVHMWKEHPVDFTAFLQDLPQALISIFQQLMTVIYHTVRSDFLENAARGITINSSYLITQTSAVTIIHRQEL